MQYFEGLRLEAEIKTRYKQLAKEYHPDLGGCANTMKLINTQYERVITGAYQTAGKSITEIDDLLANDLVLRQQLYTIVTLEGLLIEICGCWLWVTGETRIHKERLKVAGFYWSKTKSAWYWRSKENRSFNRRTMNLDEIRSKHGSYAVPLKRQAALA